MTQVDCVTDDDHNLTTRMPSFIFKGRLCAANVYKSKKNIDMKAFIPSFLTGLWQGLNFIHKEHLVHLELNLDTVMVECQSGMVKLCQHCKPRKAQLPSDLSVDTKSAVCLSPPVLRGSVYEKSDDIYAFGLLMWELLYPDNPPYKEERKWPLHRFIKEVHQSKILNPELEVLNASFAVRTLLDGCNKRTVTMKYIFSFIENIDQDPAIKALQSHQSKSFTRYIHGRSQGLDGELQNNAISEQIVTPAVDRTHQILTSSSTDSSMPGPIRSKSTFYVPIGDETTPNVQSGAQPSPILRLRAGHRYSQDETPDISQVDFLTYHRPSLPDQRQLALASDERFAVGCISGSPIPPLRNRRRLHRYFQVKTQETVKVDLPVHHRSSLPDQLQLNLASDEFAVGQNFDSPIQQPRARRCLNRNSDNRAPDISELDIPLDHRDNLSDRSLSTQASHMQSSIESNSVSSYGGSTSSHHESVPDFPSTNADSINEAEKIAAASPISIQINSNDDIKSDDLPAGIEIDRLSFLN